MRRANIIIFVTLMIVLMIPNAIGVIYDVWYKCPNECVKSRDAIWFVNISNMGQDNLDVAGISIIDQKYEKMLAESEEVELTTTDLEIIGSNKLAITTIEKYDSHLFNVTGTLTSPNYNLTMVYRFCLTLRNKFDSWGKIGPTNTFCYPENHSLEMIECTMDSDCKAEEYCKNKDCVMLDCNECQYIEEHRCVNYGCCSNNDCKGNEVCTNNNCTLIECNDRIITDTTPDGNLTNKTEKRYIAEHNCSVSPCSYDEIIVDYSCVAANCSYDEHIVNYSCTKLICAFDDRYFNNSCVKLNCSNGQGIVDHKCDWLECNNDERIYNYSCTKLDCKFFQLPQNHECVINTVLFFETVLFIIIAVFFLIDIKKFRGSYRRKLVDKLMKKLKENQKKK